MVRKIQQGLDGKERRFLLSLAAGTPKWSLLDIAHLEQRPGIRWKLHNLAQLQKAEAKKFAEQADLLAMPLPRKPAPAKEVFFLTVKAMVEAHVDANPFNHAALRDSLMIEVGVNWRPPRTAADDRKSDVVHGRGIRHAVYVARSAGRGRMDRGGRAEGRFCGSGMPLHNRNRVAAGNSDEGVTGTISTSLLAKRDSSPDPCDG